MSESADMLEPLRILVLCTRNSARSQIAEALFKSSGGARVSPASAGSDPGPGVHPLAVATLAEIGIDWRGHTSQGIDEVIDAEWDAVITVCDAARDACPYMPTVGLTAHWGVEDPAMTTGTLDQRLAGFRATRTQLHRAVTAFFVVAASMQDRRDAEILRAALGAGARELHAN